MIRGMYSAISGLRTHQVMLDVTSNNLANVNTIGYKASRTTFKDQLQQTMYGGSAQGPNTGGTNAAQVGLGVQLDAVMGEGSMQATGNPLDVAIQGEGWFRVGLGDPGDPTATPPVGPVSYPTGANMNYTRAGNFIRNDKGFVVTPEGYYVLGVDDAAGNPSYINVPPGASGIAVGNDGQVSFIPNGGGVRTNAGQISLAKFPNENGLLRLSGNRWAAHPASGTPDVKAPGTSGTFGQTIGGTLEMSNVDLAGEFTAMIVAQRGFQANSRVISTADEMLQDLVNLKH
jgi:flagellar hook protein FlgE